MFDYRTYPYRQVFEGSDGKLYYITRFSENKSTFQVEECPGEEVINFCEMDLTEYRKRFEEFDNTPFSPDKYTDMINTAYDLLDLLRPLHSFTHLLPKPDSVNYSMPQFMLKTRVHLKRYFLS